MAGAMGRADGRVVENGRFRTSFRLRAQPPLTETDITPTMGDLMSGTAISFVSQAALVLIS